MDIAEKITLLNQATLESFKEQDKVKIIERFTETGLKILEADFGFVFWKQEKNETYQLIYKSPKIPFEPNLPRETGHNFLVEQTGEPCFLNQMPKENDSKYDLAPYMTGIAIIPMMYKNHKYGNMVICFKKAPVFSEEHKTLSVALGNSAAQAITINSLVASEQEARLDAETQKNRFKSLIENSYDIIALISPAGEMLYISPSAEKISGYTPQLIVDGGIKEFVYEKDLPMLNLNIQEILQNPKVVKTLEFRYRHKDSTVRWLESAMLYNPELGGGNIVANIRDITERKEAQETILHQALHDPLTNLPNRKEFSIRVDQALESAKRHKRMLSVMFFDMDRFKGVNDTLGHEVGDSLLKIAASRFLSCVRMEDTVARFGGDEFVILLNEIHSSQEAAMVAEKILKTIAMPAQIGKHTFHPSVSIGIAIFPHDGEDKESLKKHADAALYRVKERGGNSYSLYDRTMDNYAADQLVLENELREAISSNQIEFYYQPVISLKTGKAIAMEALARWQHPQKGMLLPASFIPLAEESGLILALSDHAIKSVCRQHQAWQALGFPKLRMALNLSSKSFLDDQFLSKLAFILGEFSMEPGVLEMEITESLAMGNLELTEFNLKQLKRMGVKITIDDFGTGYSSLSYLKRFPIQHLKIDRSFIRHCITDEHDAGITRAIISMAHSLNLKVIAEGVETDQQQNFLTSLGCDAAQGFFIGKPMPAKDVAGWLEERGLKKKIPANQMQLQIADK